MLRACVATMCAGLSMACGDSGRAAAETAGRAAESAFDSVKTEARRYAPDQVATLEESVASMKERYAQGDYARALSDATGLAPRIAALKASALERKAALTNTWEAMADLPTMTAALEARIKALAKDRQLPADVTKDSVARAQRALASIRAEWTEALQAFTEGELARAVDRAQAVKARLLEAMASLGMPAPEATR